MSELEKKAKQLTDEELKQVTGGGELHADKDSETFRVALGRGVNDGGAQGDLAKEFLLRAAWD